MSIPRVDLSRVNVTIPNEELNEADLGYVAGLVKQAFTEWGFVYFTGHGIASELISEVFQVSKDFFQLPLNVKEKYKRGESGPNSDTGYIKMGMEVFHPDKPYDIKEAFNIGIKGKDERHECWPTEVPKFEPTVRNFYKICGTLAQRVLHIIGLALELEDPLLFAKSVEKIGDLGNSTILRTLFYPPIEKKEDVIPGQIRCGEHSDYGAITLLFQDDMGGLMVKRKSGEFVPATPVKDAVLVNIADLMQRWTSDKLISVKHKVIIPEEEVRYRSSRQSVAFFVHPDDALDIECIDGSNKCPVVNALDYLLFKLNSTFDYKM